MSAKKLKHLRTILQYHLLLLYHSTKLNKYPTTILTFVPIHMQNGNVIHICQPDLHAHKIICGVKYHDQHI